MYMYMYIAGVFAVSCAFIILTGWWMNFSVNEIAKNMFLMEKYHLSSEYSVYTAVGKVHFNPCFFDTDTTFLRPEYS